MADCWCALLSRGCGAGDVARESGYPGGIHIAWSSFGVRSGSASGLGSARGGVQEAAAAGSSYDGHRAVPFTGRGLGAERGAGNRGGRRHRPVGCGAATLPRLLRRTRVPTVGKGMSCGNLMQVTGNGTVVSSDPSQGPYDGDDDTLVGMINDSSEPVSASRSSRTRTRSASMGTASAAATMTPRRLAARPRSARPGMRPRIRPSPTLRPDPGNRSVDPPITRAGAGWDLWRGCLQIGRPLKSLKPHHRVDGSDLQRGWDRPTCSRPQMAPTSKEDGIIFL